MENTPTSPNLQPAPVESPLPSSQSQGVTGIALTLSVIALIGSVIANVLLYQQVTQLKFEQRQLDTRSTQLQEPLVGSQGITDGWMVYREPKSGMTFSYPPDILINAPTEGGNQTTLKVTAQKLNEIEDLTMNYTAEQAYKDQQSLLKGEYGEQIDFALPESEEVFPVPGGFGKRFLVLARFDICDVIFNRKAIFYRDNYQVTISYTGPDSLKLSESEYFKIEEERCGSFKMWREGHAFYPNLQSGQAFPEAQQWYDTFDTILMSIEFSD
jgi:hypothetical protein